MYLVDTNVLSAGAPTKALAKSGLADWMDRNSSGLYLSVITIAEVQDSIAKAWRQAAHRKAEQLAAWLEMVLHLYAARVLPVDLATAKLLGGLSDRTRGWGQSPGLADLAIAATAQARGYTVLTRNLRHFRSVDVASLDPFECLPAELG